MAKKTETLKNEVPVQQALRALYKSYGYTRFKMNKFEEYDTYARVKDFLISDKVITFTDTNGKLLAMKPDVTVSIIKNTDDVSGQVQKVYYNENVYRVSGGAHAYREIMQAGLECLGDIDTYHIAEVISLAVQSLASICDEYVLDISHMGFVSGLLKAAEFTEENMSAALRAVSEKNLPALTTLCEQAGVCQALTEKITALITEYGPICEVLPRLSLLCVNEEMELAANKMRGICDALCACGLEKHVQLDFSVVNDMNYYNGIVFSGYVAGLPAGVLSGGQYDKLMKKMGKNAKAIGFAVYLDQLERLWKREDNFDADVLLQYDDSVKPETVLLKAQEITKSGKTVLVLKNVPESVRTKERVLLANGGAK